MYRIIAPYSDLPEDRAMVGKVTWHKRLHDPVQALERLVTFDTSEIEIEIVAEADDLVCRVYVEEGRETISRTVIGIIAAGAHEVLPSEGELQAVRAYTSLPVSSVSLPQWVPSSARRWVERLLNDA